MTAASATVWSLARAVAHADDPDLDRRLGAAVGVPVLVVDLDRPPRPDEAEALERLGRRAAALPVVTVAVDRAGNGPDPTGDERAPVSFDLVVADPEPVVAGILAHPHAAVVAAQVLRRPATTPHDALMVESFAYATLQAGPEHAAWLARRGRRVRPPVEEPRVRLADEGERWRITLDRPRLRNLVDAALRDELVEALRVVAADPAAREVLLEGAGPVFCAGGDPAEFGSRPDPASAHLVRTQANVAPWLVALAGRLRVVVHGAAVGAGIEMAAFAGRVDAHPDTRFRLPEITMGLVPGAGGTVSIPARIGRRRTLWWLLTDATVDAATAHRWGLVDGLGP